MRKSSMKLISVFTSLLLVISFATAGAGAASSGVGDLRGADFFKAVASGGELDENAVQQIKDYLGSNGNFRNNTISTFVAKEKIMVRDTSKKTLDLELRGTVAVSDTCKVYQFLNHKLLDRSLNDVMVGAGNVYVVFNVDGKAQVIIIDGETHVTDVRVGISTTAMDSMELGNVDIMSADGFKLSDRIADSSFDIEPGAAVSFNVDTAAGTVIVTKAGAVLYSTANRLYAEPVSEESMLQVTSIKRGYGIPKYRGLFEITMSKTATGKLRLVNEVPMEKYLYQVVPSEMPASFGLEALKAQAVAARTYALNECFSNAALAAQGILVYDSVLSQVYNNSAENALTNQAVDATAGMVLMKDGKYVDCRYYSTSGGYGASKNEVWSDAGTQAFPGEPVSYLTARSYTYDPLDSSRMYSMDTADENAINAFYKDLSFTGYDSDSLYFRWKVALTKQQLENTINRNIKLRYAADPLFILTRDETGNFVSKAIPAEGIGTLVNMYVSRRGAGGNMMELVIEGSTGVYKIIKEYNIRFTIRPTKADTGASTDILAYRAKGGSTSYDSSPLKNPSILYSAFCTFDIEKDASGNIQGVTFYGGGNGHGVGMSQYGAQCLGLNKGFAYESILSEYYGGSELVSMYDYESDASVLDRLFRILDDYEEKVQNSANTEE